MVGKPNLPSDVDLRPGLRGSVLDGHANALDRDRAASMADEGGVAGAVMDTRDQFAAIVGPEYGSSWPKWWQWAAVAIGSAVLVATLVAVYRHTASTSST